MRTAILVTALLVASGFAMAGSSEETTTWRTIADDPLLEAFDAGQDPLTIVVQGPKIIDPLHTPETRADWNAYWASQAEPFLSGFEKRVTQMGGTVTNTFPAVNAAFATVPNDRVPALLSDSEMRRAGLDWDGAIELQVQPDAPGIMADLPETIAKVQAQEMWAQGYRGEGVLLAVIDTGLRPTHEMLRNADGTTRVGDWHDATTPVNTRCQTPCDTNGHGTHVGTTAAGSNFYNPDSPQGVAPEADILGIRIFRGFSGQWEWGQEGLQEAFDRGADVTTNSWGGGCFNGGLVTAELAETLQNAGMLNVFAAGNSGTGGVLCPGSVHNVVTVGGIDVNDNLYSSSSRGPCEWPTGSGNQRVCPEVNAVAVNVVAGCHQSDTHYCSKTGTSMATPHVAGAVVLLQEAKIAHTGEGLSAPDMEDQVLLRYTAKDLGTPGPNNDFGWGTAQTLDAYNLLTSDDGVNIGELFTIEQDEIRQHESTNVNFAVANLGSVVLDGRYTIKAEQISFGSCPPACHEEVVIDEQITLGPIQEKWETAQFSGDDLAAGEYLLTARFDYTYTDPDDGADKDGLIEYTASLHVLRVEWQLERGFPEQAHVGQPLLGGIVLTNVGNDDAKNVRFHELFQADGLVPAPAVPPGVGQWGAFANPAPTDVVWVTWDPMTLRYEWDDIGDVDGFGEDWEAQYNFAAGQPGDYILQGTLRYQDPTGHSYVQQINQPITIGLLP